MPTPNGEVANHGLQVLSVHFKEVRKHAATLPVGTEAALFTGLVDFCVPLRQHTVSIRPILIVCTTRTYPATPEMEMGWAEICCLPKVSVLTNKGNTTLHTNLVTLFSVAALPRSQDNSLLAVHNTPPAPLVSPHLSSPPHSCCPPLRLQTPSPSLPPLPARPPAPLN